MKLIDKDVLVEEINKYLEYANNGISYAQAGIEKGLKKYESDLNAWQHCQSMCKNILSFLNTLEVKEVDLESEVEKCLKKHHMLAVGRKDFENIAKQFFELGIKVQK